MNLQSQPERQEADAPVSARISSLFDYVEMLAWALFAVMILFTFAVRLCRVDGASMENTLQNGQKLLINDIAYTPKTDDIIVFHLTAPEIGMEKTLVKRVIATGGQNLEIHFDTGEIYVDGVQYEDAHRTLKNFRNEETGIYTLKAEHHYDPITHTLRATVPDGYLFVMGDNRNNSRDSRDSDIRFIDERCVLGKVVLRLSPFTAYR